MRANRIGASFGCVVLLSVGATGCHKALMPLPALAPMPPIPASRPVGSVTMLDPAAVPEVSIPLPIQPGPFAPTWESISAQHPGEPAWLREARFGIWVHFGPQSAGQSGDWYAKRMYLQTGKNKQYYENHLRDFGHPSQVGYKDLLRTWNPAKLDPAELVQIYRDAGARFLFIQGVHHDNFDNWDSRYQPWNSVNLGPHRDLLREWTSAARKAGMHYGITFHHEYTWWWFQTAFGADATGPLAGVPYDGHLSLADGKGTWWEGLDPRLLYTIDLREYKGLDVEGAPASGIFQNHQAYAQWYATWWALRIMDVIDKYDPDFIYTDGNSTQPFTGLKSATGARLDAMQRVAAHFFNHTLATRGSVDTFCIVKFAPPRKGVVNTQEGRIPAGIKADQPWIGETPVGDWFYTPDAIYDARMVIRYLLENAARDGATAICVSQKPDGSLDEGSRKVLHEVGNWLRINGDGIYGSRAWRTWGEGAPASPATRPSDDRPRVLPGGRLGERQANFEFTTADFRFTQGKDGGIYAYCMTVPAPGETLRIKSLGKSAAGNPVRSVELLGSHAKLEWTQEPGALVIRCPREFPAKLAAGFRVRLGE